MQSILRQASRITILGALAASTALAQSPPPTSDPTKVAPPSEQQQKSQQQPVQQQDTVSPKNSKEDVDASLVLHYAVLVAHFLAPEAIPGALVVPLRGGFEIAGAGREVLANYVFV